jgi:hypothetical protein
VPILKQIKPSSPKRKEVQYASYDAAIKEAEKILGKYKATLGKFAE